MAKSHMVSTLASGVILLAILSVPVATHAFDTLDGDRTNWSNNPTFSVGRLSPNIANQDQLRAIRAGFSAWANVPGSSISFDERADGGDITVDFVQSLE